MRDQSLVFLFYRIDAIDFRMCLPENTMIAFSDDAVVMHQHCSYHGVGRHISLTKSGKLEATVHVSFVNGH